MKIDRQILDMPLRRRAGCTRVGKMAFPYSIFLFEKQKQSIDLRLHMIYSKVIY